MDTLILAIGTAPSARGTIDMNRLVTFLKETGVTGRIIAIDERWDAKTINELKNGLDQLYREWVREQREEQQQRRAAQEPEFDDPNAGLEGGAGTPSGPPPLPDFRLVEQNGQYFIGPNPIEFRKETLESSYFPNRGDQDVTIQQDIVRRFATLRDLGNTCAPKTDAWKTLKEEANRYASLYIYNCAWWDSPRKVKRNGYFEEMCELANIAATHPNATLILDNDTKAFFRDPVKHGEIIYTLSMPAALNRSIPRLSGGRRKRTRRGLQKRRASRRWKHRS